MQYSSAYFLDGLSSGGANHRVYISRFAPSGRHPAWTQTSVLNIFRPQRRRIARYCEQAARRIAHYVALGLIFPDRRPLELRTEVELEALHFIIDVFVMLIAEGLGDTDRQQAENKEEV